MLKKKNWPSFQRIVELFTQKFVTKLSKIWPWDPGSEIRDPEKTYSWIPDPGVKKAPDPGSATLNCIKKGEGKYCGKNSPHRRSFVIRVRLHFNALKRKKHFETSLSFH